MTWLGQVSETVLLALQITVIGMSLVFLTLALIILTVVLLTRLPGLRMARDSQEPPKEIPKHMQIEAVAVENSQPDYELARVAAIAVALLHSRSGVRARQKTQARRSAWKSYGRAHQLGL